jgi:hypothetical protein
VKPEAISWDESRGSFLVGTVDTGAVLAVTPAGEVEELLRASDENGLLAITGIAVDAARKKLWLSSAGVPGFVGLKQADLGRGALLEFNLESLELLKRYVIPVDGLPHVPGSLELTPGGDVYLSIAMPMVFRKWQAANRWFTCQQGNASYGPALSTMGKPSMRGCRTRHPGGRLERDSSARRPGWRPLNIGGISDELQRGSLL